MQGEKMKKKSRIGICLCMCMAMLLSAFSFYTEAYAYDKNEATLHFNNHSSFRDGGAIYLIDGDYYKIELCKKELDENTNITYTKVDLPESNDKKIDLNADSYYLRVIPCTESGESESGSGNLWKVKLYIDETRFDLGGNSYAPLQSARYNGTIQVRLEKADQPPVPPSFPDEIAIRASYNGFGMEVFFNNKRLGQEASQITATGKGYATGSIRNLIQIKLAFGDGNIESITVNGDEIPIPEGTKDELSFTVEPSSFYNIVVKRQDSSGVPRTIIWESDKSDNSGLKDDELLKHGTVEILEVRDADGNSIGLENIKQDTAKNEGLAVIIPGSKVVFRLTPDYGYQMTSGTLGGEALTARDETSTFEYTMPDANVHISGIFEKVDNKVVTTVPNIKSGEIQIGDAEIASGSVVLSVKDAELTDAQKAKFADAAEGYQISTYFSMDLAQVFYKGNADEIWSNGLDTLKSDATVKLQLTKGLNGKNIAIVHEKKDGTYEVIPATYDADTQTITFRTASFSNYAIASKTDAAAKAEKPTSGQVKTGDHDLPGWYAGIVLFALLTIGSTCVIKKKKQQRL